MNTDAWGIDVIYEDAAGALQHISEEDLQVVRSAIGPPPKMSGSWFEERVKIVRLGESIPLPSSAELTLEDGTCRKIQDRLPQDLPIGYHSLHLKKQSSTGPGDRESWMLSFSVGPSDMGVECAAIRSPQPGQLGNGRLG